MREIVKKYNVYKLNELTGINRRNALDAIRRLRLEEFEEFRCDELVSSMVEAADKFGFDAYEIHISLFNCSYVKVDNEEHDVMSDDRRQELSKWINDNTEAGVKGHGLFTGSSYDCFFFDYFKGNGGATATTLENDIPRAISYMLRKATLAEERSITNDNHGETYAEYKGLEFYEDGEVFND